MTDTPEEPHLALDDAATALRLVLAPVPPDAVTDVTTTTRQVLYDRRLGVQRYTITQVAPEILAGWKRQIEEIRDALQAFDRENMGNLLKRNNKVRGDLDVIEGILTNEALQPDDYTLLAIGLWIFREKARWPGDLVAGMKVLWGGEFSVGHYREKGGNPTCIDIAVLVDTMTKEFGINGHIYRFGKNGLNHRVWENADHTRMMDVLWAWPRGGFITSQKQYEAVIRGMPFLSNMHIGMARRKRVQEF